MADSVINLLQSNYDEKYGVVNVRPVVDILLKRSRDPFAEVSATFQEAQPQWRLPLLEAMRVLAATGHCNEQGAQDILKATDDVAVDSGVDEYFKSVNALASAPRTARALGMFVAHLLETRRDDFARRLAFYTVGMLLNHQTTKLDGGLRDALKSAAEAEESDQLRTQFREIISLLYKL